MSCKAANRLPTTNETGVGMREKRAFCENERTAGVLHKSSLVAFLLLKFYTEKPCSISIISRTIAEGKWKLLYLAYYRYVLG